MVYNWFYIDVVKLVYKILFLWEMFYIVFGDVLNY